MLKVRIFRLAVNLMAILFWRRRAPRNLSVDDRDIPTRGGRVRARIYAPLTTGPHPVVVYFHGGGFVVGGLLSVDGTCRDIAASTGHAVISVDYRLAPEHPFPAAADDCIDAVHWVRDNAALIGADAGKIYVAGDSAGGNLAAVCALHCRDTDPGLVRGQVLLYPVTHHYSHGTASYGEKATGHGLTRDMMVWFWDQYYQGSEVLAEGQITHPLGTPLAVDDLSGLPPALVLTAEHDPLRDEGEEYAQKMIAAGVDVQYTLYANARHGFVGSMGPTDEHRKGIDEIASWLASRET